jgi:hypothetical protein
VKSKFNSQHCKKESRRKERERERKKEKECKVWTFSSDNVKAINT